SPGSSQRESVGSPHMALTSSVVIPMRGSAGAAGGFFLPAAFLGGFFISATSLSGFFLSGTSVGGWLLDSTCQRKILLKSPPYLPTHLKTSAEASGGKKSTEKRTHMVFNIATFLGLCLDFW